MKTRTPFSSVILYLLGVIFMIVAGFMLWAAIDYTKLYLASYDYTFADMWSNSLQYIIEKVMPSFAAGAVCLGLGKAISVYRKGLAAQATGTAFAGDQTGSEKGNEAAAGSVEEVSLKLQELREVGSIKLEELERREKVRLDDMRETMVRDMALHRLQREAKEEEIISKLNAMGEKMGLDMMDLYAKADIPVVPEQDDKESEGDDKLKDDPLFEELDKAEGAPAEEEPVIPEEIEEKSLEEEPDVPIEDPETPIEDLETPVEEPETSVEEPEIPTEEHAGDDAGEYGDDQILTHTDELGVPEQVDAEETGASEEQVDAEEAGVSEEQVDAEDAGASEEQVDVEETGVSEEQVDAEDAGASEEQVDAEEAGASEEQADVEEADSDEVVEVETSVKKPGRSFKKRQKRRKKRTGNNR